MLKRPAGSGLRWIAGGWILLKTRPGLVIGGVTLMYLLLIVSSLMPMVGLLLPALLGPFLSGGLVVVFARIAEILERSEAEPLAKEQPIGFDLLFSQFSGNAPWQSLLGVATVSIVFNLLLLLIISAVIGAGADAKAMEIAGGDQMDQAEMAAMLLSSMSPGLMLTAALVVVVVWGLYLAMTLYAVPLIVLRGFALKAAFAASFFATFRNWLPLLILGALWLLMAMTIPLTLFISAFLVVPLGWAAFYASFVSIFPEQPPEQSEDLIADKSTGAAALENK
ncbi:MAG TPA: hypothetical protein ENM98_05360, partial [Halothiobacillaceae bacterium]|nr:hypothetical protein [Halothiobacillaceae bacterium]